MANDIDFYFDFSSPYGYFAAAMIDDLAARFDRKVVWRPIMLGPAFKVSGNKPIAEQPLKSEYCRHDWARMARAQKMPWKMPDPFPVAALAPSRAFYWLSDRDPGLARLFARSVYSAFFGEGRDITSAEVTADLAAALMVDRAELLAALRDDAVKQRLKDETQAAIGRGVFGSPFFFVDGEPFWGSDRLWMIKHWLRDGGW
jgi:2-hydroxychromene-2-carboxylate isomerase